MGLACRDILRVEGPVEIDGGAEILHQGVGFGAESPAPANISLLMTDRS